VPAEPADAMASGPRSPTPPAEISQRRVARAGHAP